MPGLIQPTAAIRNGNLMYHLWLKPGRSETVAWSYHARVGSDHLLHLRSVHLTRLQIYGDVLYLQIQKLSGFVKGGVSSHWNQNLRILNILLLCRIVTVCLHSKDDWLVGPWRHLRYNTTTNKLWLWYGLQIKICPVERVELYDFTVPQVLTDPWNKFATILTISASILHTPGKAVGWHGSVQTDSLNTSILSRVKASPIWKAALGGNPFCRQL